MVVEMSFEEKLEAIQLKIKNAVERINTEEINTVLRAIEGEYILVKECEMNDTISRQDVLDAVGHGTVYDSREIQQIIRDMPPARRVESEGEDNFRKPKNKRGAYRPKGHGRLIDGDALLRKWVFDKSDKLEIYNAPTIIGADKEDK